MFLTTILVLLVLDAMWITHSILTAPIINDEEYLSLFSETSLN
jgi:hypothetical protein